MAGEKQIEKSDLESQLAALINRMSLENGSNTPDFILGDLLAEMLRAVDRAIRSRDSWYGVEHRPGMERPADKAEVRRMALDQAIEEMRRTVGPGARDLCIRAVEYLRDGKVRSPADLDRILLERRVMMIEKILEKISAGSPSFDPGGAQAMLASLRSSLLGWDQESPAEIPIGDLQGIPPVPGSGS